MKYDRMLILIGCLLAAGVVAAAQQPAPAAEPQPAVVPAAPLPPLPPAPAPAPAAIKSLPALEATPAIEWGVGISESVAQEAQERAQEALERSREQIERAKERMQEQAGRMAEMRIDLGDSLAKSMVFAQNMNFERGEKFRTSGSENGLYQRGQSAIQSRHWDEALEAFTQVAARAGARADGALYWKAYTLNKLGRRDEALAALAELRKSYSGSRWLDDAKALELEVKQASGQKVAPESESDEDLKLMAINGLMQSDPDRAFPLLEKLLKGAQSPRVKQHALFVLAQNNSPRGKQVLEQVARGGGNPDLQLTAIRYLSESLRKQGNGSQVLWEIYSSSSDVNVKRAVLNAFGSARDQGHLLQIAKTEKLPELRMDAIGSLSAGANQAELWQLYQAESSREVKQQLLDLMSRGANTDKLLDVARSEKDPKLRISAIHRLAGMKNPNNGEALVALYGSEQDRQVRRAVVDSLCSQNNVKAVVELARKEQDPEMRRELVGRLSGMKSKEAADYLSELLNK